MKLRSLLFVPGDRPERMHKAAQSGADALILDLEDSVAPAQKPAARAATAAFLAGRGGAQKVFVRINPLGGGMVEHDLAACAAHWPDGIVLPKAEGASSLMELFTHLEGVSAPELFILPIVTETPVAMFRLGEYGASPLKLAGLTWGAEDLPAALGARAARESDGGYTPPYEIARAMTLFAAGAANVPAIETVFPDFKNDAGLAAYASRGARDGFSGMMAIHPAQIETINSAFTPRAEDVAQARAIVQAFADNPGAGVIAFEGKMLDAPHLKQARALLARAGEV